MFSCEVFSASMNEEISYSRRLLAEALGTLLLLTTVVGSGIMGESLSQGNDALALLGNTLATGAILAVLITILGPFSGAHFNPAVTLSFLMRGEIGIGQSLGYVVVQFGAAVLGVVLAHVMFDLDPVQTSTKLRSGLPQMLSETVATFGLVATILGTLRVRPKAVGAMVGLYISAGYWFTASTSFANPAVTFGRCFTESFSGIAATDVAGFIVAQLLGALLATLLFRWLEGEPRHK